MKKLTIIALSAALTLALVVACGGGETTTENAPVAPAGSEPATSADGGAVVDDSGDIDAGDGEFTGEDIAPPPRRQATPPMTPMTLCPLTPTIGKKAPKSAILRPISRLTILVRAVRMAGNN